MKAIIVQSSPISGPPKQNVSMFRENVYSLAFPHFSLRHENRDSPKQTKSSAASETERVSMELWSGNWIQYIVKFKRKRAYNRLYIKETRRRKRKKTRYKGENSFHYWISMKAFQFQKLQQHDISYIISNPQCSNRGRYSKRNQCSCPYKHSSMSSYNTKFQSNIKLKLNQKKTIER